MANNIYNIQSVSVGTGLTTATATKIKFHCSYVPNTTSMFFSYDFLDASSEYLASGEGVVSGSALADWGSDDQYIINTMAGIAGVTLVD